MLLKKEKKKEPLISDLQRMLPSDLTKNSLWDSHWLEKRYLDTFHARREMNKIIKEIKQKKLNQKNA